MLRVGAGVAPMYARYVMEEIKERIEEKIKEKGLLKKDIARTLGFKSQSGLTNALKGSLKVQQLMILAQILDIPPSELFPVDFQAEYYKLSIVDLIKIVCDTRIDERIKEKYLKKLEDEERERE